MGPSINPSPSIDDVSMYNKINAANRGHAYNRARERQDEISGFLDLFLKAGVSISKPLNLFIGGQGIQVEGDLSLFLCNNYIAGGLDLFISGDGENDGWSLVYKPLNLFLACPTRNCLDLYLRGPGVPTTESLDLVLFGSTIESSQLNLFLMGQNEITKQLDLFIRGH